jgi:hypothetical protein
MSLSDLTSLCLDILIFSNQVLSFGPLEREKCRLFYTRARPLPCESRQRPFLFASTLHSPWLPFRDVVHFPHYVLRQHCKLHVSYLLFNSILIS